MIFGYSTRCVLESPGGRILAEYDLFRDFALGGQTGTGRGDKVVRTPQVSLGGINDPLGYKRKTKSLVFIRLLLLSTFSLCQHVYHM